MIVGQNLNMYIICYIIYAGIKAAKWTDGWNKITVRREGAVSWEEADGLWYEASDDLTYKYFICWYM